MRAKWALLFFFLALYVLTNGGHAYSTDEESMFFVTAAMARRGGFDIPPQTDAPVSLPMQGVDGKLYSPYGLLPSIGALPLYHVGAVLAFFFPLSYTGFFLRFVMVLLLSPLYTALTVMLLYQAVIMLGYSQRSAILTACCYGLGTMAWVYSKTFFSEPLGTLLLVVAFVALLKYARTPRLDFVAASGLAVGFGVATKVAEFINVPLLFLYLVWLLYAKRDTLDRRAWIQAIVVWGVSAGAIVAGVGLYNFVRFGNPLQTGYGNGFALFSFPLWQGLYGLLASPGKSLFLYSPIVILALPAFWLLMRQRRMAAVWCLGIIGLHLVTYGVYGVWHGDSAWGPRFMLFILPFMVLPLAALWEWLGIAAHAWWRVPVAVLGAVSVLVQVAGGLVNFDTYLTGGVPAELRYYDPASSPLVGQVRVLVAQLSNTQPLLPMPEGSIARFGWFFDPGQPHPFDVWFLYLIHSGMSFDQVAWFVLPVVGLCLVGLIWSGRALWKSWQTATVI